jgi:hypothetical protein
MLDSRDNPSKEWLLQTLWLELCEGTACEELVLVSRPPRHRPDEPRIACYCDRCRNSYRSSALFKEWVATVYTEIDEDDELE